MAFTNGAFVQYYITGTSDPLASFPSPIGAYVVSVAADGTASLAVIPPGASYVAGKTKVVQGTGPGQAT